MKCEDCKHWSKDTDGDYPDHFKLGKCKRVELFWDATEWEPPGYERQVLTEKARGNKAFVQDGSDYRAELLTLSDFGCVQFEKI
jgi:hypothetical protein